MKKGLFGSIFLVIITAVVIYNFNSITKYITSLLQNEPTVVISKPNEYFKNVSYDYVKESKDFVPYSKQDLYNIFFTILDYGYQTFTFYCPDEYMDCLNDVKSISDDTNTLTHINNFVSPYNNFSNIEVIYSTSGEINITVSKLYTNDEITEINNKIDEIIKNVITDNMKDEDKILAIHDYIINNTKYDQNREKGTTQYKSNIAYGSLMQGYAVCGGYADAMALFLNRFNIPNFKIATTSHVWNAVYINNEWLHLDLTWDDPVSINSDQDNLLHKFYLIDTPKLESYNNADHDFDKTIYQELSY